MTKPCVVFDLDGTLADTSADLLAAANACFRDLGLGDILEHGRDSGVALRGGRSMLTAGLKRVGYEDLSQIDKQYQPLLDHYAKAISEHTVMYPGAVDAIKDLRAMGYATAICTNKPEGLAQTLMANIEVRDLFDSLIGADTLPVRKPDPAPFWASVDQAGGDRARCLLVGDTDTDRNTSKNADVPSILVTFGPGGGDMAALQPEALMSDYSQLAGLTRDLIGPAT